MPSYRLTFFEYFSFDFLDFILIFGGWRDYFEVLHIYLSTCSHLKSTFCFPMKFSSLFLQAISSAQTLYSELSLPGLNLTLAFPAFICFSAILFYFAQILSSIPLISIDFFALEFSLLLQSGL